jgi:hypothetical protein
MNILQSKGHLAYRMKWSVLLWVSLGVDGDLAGRLVSDLPP